METSVLKLPRRNEKQMIENVQALPGEQNTFLFGGVEWELIFVF